jgi:tetratricopeptide (TPR) repeat protein
MVDDVSAILRRSQEFRQRHASQVRTVGAAQVKVRKDGQDLIENGYDANRRHEISSTLYTVRQLTSDPRLVPADVLGKYLEVATRAMVNLGTGIDSGATKEAITAAIARFHDEGLSASELYLSYQRYLSYGTLESNERKKAIRAAIVEADNLDTEFRATYALGWYMVEVSQYKHALDVCERASRRAAANGQELWELSFRALEGVARYTTLNEPDRVYDLLTSILPRFADRPRFEDADLAYAEALHYLGRCELDRANTLVALELFMKANSIRDRYPFESRATAYFHIRMAEALIGVHNLRHAWEHLEAARSFLDRVGDESAGRILHQFALANYLVEKGEFDEAIQCLDGAARSAKREKFARGHLLTLGRLFTIQWAEGKVIAAMMIIIRAIPIVFSGELRHNSALAIAANFKRYALAVLRPYRPQEKKSQDMLSCPCQLHV